jgi:hypothetical protein
VSTWHTDAGRTGYRIRITTSRFPLSSFLFDYTLYQTSSFFPHEQRSQTPPPPSQAHKREHNNAFISRNFLSSKRQPPNSNLPQPPNHPTLLQLNNPPKRLLSLPNLPPKLMRPRKRQPSLRIVPPDSQPRETREEHVSALASGEAVELGGRGGFAGCGGDAGGEFGDWCGCCWGCCC